MIRNTTLICTARRLAFPLYRNETTLNEYQSLSIPAVHCPRICCHRSQLCHPTSRHFRNPSSFYKSLPFPNAYCSLSCIYKELYQRHPHTHILKCNPFSYFYQMKPVLYFYQKDTQDVTVKCIYYLLILHFSQILGFRWKL